MMNQASCEDRIKGQLENTLEMIAPDCEDCQKGYCSDHIAGQDVLSIDKVTVYRVTLSTGGPASAFVVHINDNEIEDLFFEFQDWFDGANRRLVGEARKLVESWIWSQLYIEELQ